jgi:membrane associated rhomboid family serine protease
MYERENPVDELKRFIRSGNTLVKLLVINIAVWLLMSVIIVFAFLFNIVEDNARNVIVDWLAVPSSLGNLAARPWTIFTYMFLHFSFWHILFNMLWLYWFGRIFLEFLSQKQMLATYIAGGFAGGALYILAYNIFPVFEGALSQSHALGASASVMAIVTTISFYAPGYSINLIFLGRVRILYIAIILFVLDFFMIRSDNAGGHLAHIGGAIFGFFYASYLRKGKDITGFLDWFRLNRIKSYFTKPGSGSKDEYSAYSRPLSDEDYNKNRADNRKRMDSILDKISRSGYDSLTKDEKEFLFRSSKNNQ